MVKRTVVPSLEGFFFRLKKIITLIFYYHKYKTKIAELFKCNRKGQQMHSNKDSFNENDQLYRNLFNVMNEGVAICEIIFDKNGESYDYRHLEVNSAFERIIGITAYELRGKTRRDFGDIDPYWLELFAQVVKTGRPSSRVDYSSICEKWFDLRAFSLGGDKFTFIFMDITESKRAEEELNRSNQNISEILASIQDGFLTLDRDWRFVYVNQRAAGNLGLKPEGLVGWNIWEKFPIILGTPHEINYRQVMITGQMRQFEMLGVLSEKWYCVSVYPLENGISVYWQDITVRKKTELMLRESEERYRAFFENSIDAIFITSPDGRIEAANAEACSMFGMAEAEIIQSGRDRIVDPSDPRLPGILEERERSGQVRGELNYIRKDGTIFPCEISSGLFTDKYGQTKTILIIRDITERKQAEEKLKEAHDELESRVRERTAELQHSHDTLKAETEEHKRTKKLLKEDLADTILLQSISTELLHEDNIHILYEKIVNAAMRIMHSEYASLQMLYPERGDGGELRLLAFSGFNPQAAKYWEWVKLDASSTSSMALQTGQRIIVPDVEKCEFMNGTEYLAMYLQTGIHSFQTTPLFSRSGKIVGMISTYWCYPHEPSERELRLSDILIRQAADLIEYKQVEKSLTSERELLKVTIDSLGEGVIATDKEGQIIMMNKTAAHLAGYSQSDALGEPIHKIFYILDANNSEPIFHSHSIKTFQYLTDLHHPILVTGDLQEIPIYMNCSPIITKDGQTIGAVIVFQDISEKQKLEQELGKAEKLESLGILAGGIAHDFNNILAVILSNVQLAIMKLQKNEDCKKYLLDTAEITSKASELTKQLLTFSKGGAPVKKDASLHELIRDTANFVLRGSKTRAKFVITDDLWGASVDEGQISQVIHNLVLNAQQAMPKGGTITITAFNLLIETHPVLKPGNYVRIIVQDQGVGIPKEHLSKIFDPFFTTKKEGNGLGLATSYSIIKQHDDYIEIQSQEEVGTSFSIYLPALNSVVEPKEVPNEVVVAGENLKILLMDDEIQILNAMGEMLKCHGYQVELAMDGSEVIRIYQQAKNTGEPFDVVIMDLTIPGGMGGQEVIAHLRDIDPHIKAIVSSGYANDPIMADYERHGLCGVVSKPYKFEELNLILNRVVERRQLSLKLGY